MHDFLTHTLWLGNSPQRWGYALLVAIVGFFIVKLVVDALTTHIKRRSGKHVDNQFSQTLADIVGNTRTWIIWLLVIAVALKTLTLSDQLQRALAWLVLALVGMQMAMWASAIVMAWLRHITPNSNMQKANPVIFSLLSWFAQLIIWITLLLVLLAQAGVHVGAFVASLGVGGIAIAMAAQNVLADLLASIAIGLDKPFTEGDYIAFGSVSGTVKKVGIKSTRIAALSGEELIINNASLLQQLSHNYARMQERRIAFSFQIPLNTPRKDIEKVLEVSKTIIRNQAHVRLDRGHFMGIDKDGLRFDFVFYVTDPSYAVYCDIQQAINLELVSTLETLDLNFAIPMRRLVNTSKDTNPN